MPGLKAQSHSRTNGARCVHIVIQVRRVLKQILQTLQRVLRALLTLLNAAGVGGVGGIAAHKGAGLAVLFNKPLAAGDLAGVLVAALSLADSLALSAAEIAKGALPGITSERLRVRAETLPDRSRRTNVARPAERSARSAELGEHNTRRQQNECGQGGIDDDFHRDKPGLKNGRF